MPATRSPSLSVTRRPGRIGRVRTVGGLHESRLGRDNLEDTGREAIHLIATLVIRIDHLNDAVAGRHPDERTFDGSSAGIRDLPANRPRLARGR